MPYPVYEKIMFWVDKADFEVSGFGKCIYDGKDFQVTNAILLKQEGGAAHTDIDPLSLSQAQYRLRGQPGEMKFWWHSHVNMPSFMSQTDKNTITELGSHGWAVATVFNKRREVRSALSYKLNTPFGEETSYYDDKLEFEVTYPALTETETVEYTKQFDDNVTKEIPLAMNYMGKYGEHFGNNINDDGYYNRNLPAVNDPAVDDDDSDATVSGFDTLFERECAQALGCTPKRFRKRYRKANQAQVDEMAEEIAIYWVTSRGIAPTDYSNMYDRLDVGIYDNDEIDADYTDNSVVGNADLGRHDA